MVPVLAASLGLAGACDFSHLTVEQTSTLLQRAAPALSQESDVQFAREAAPGQLKTVEGFLLADPDNRKLLGVLAQGTCEYAYGFLESDLEDLLFAGKPEEAAVVVGRARGFYLRCVNYSLALLGPAWTKDFYGDFKLFEQRVARARRSDVPGMFFAALGLGSAINLDQSDLALLVNLPRARLLFERVTQLEPGFYHGGAYMALAMLECAAGSFGGTPAICKQRFEQAIALAGPGFFMPKVLMARYYGTAVNDREFFHRTLVEVLGNSPAMSPDDRLANELAHLRAKRYLAHEKEWF